MKKGAKNMIKNKIVKKIGGICLAGVLGLSITGCFNQTKVDQDKLDTLMTDLQTYLDQQTKGEKKLSSEEKRHIMYENVTNLLNTAMDHNYTFKTDKRVTRVEYESAVTKVYHYTLDDNNLVTKEVYREIYADYVYTYIKDLGLYSKVATENTKDVVSLLTFSTSNSNVAIYTAGGQRLGWQEVAGQHSAYSDYYYNEIGCDAYSALARMYNYVKEMTIEKFVSEGIEYQRLDDKDVFAHGYVDFAEGEYDVNQNLEVFNETIEFGEKSYKTTQKIQRLQEGIPQVGDSGSRDESYFETSFDKDSSIAFSKVGYQLVDDYYIEQNN